MAQYTIQEVSEMFQLPPSTLRYYEEEGILTNIARTASGQRIYEDCHVNRLKTICCFKNTGMTIRQLKDFFSYESAEADNIDMILMLLKTHEESIVRQMNRLQNDHAHILRKLHYYSDIKKSIETNKPLPKWADYKFKDFTDND